jgi:hypothetical protein
LVRTFANNDPNMRLLADDHDSLEPDASLLREAFDLAWAKIPPSQQNVVLKSALAELVKRIAKQGETSPRRLSARALSALRGLT